jgi:hypothetical protein
VIPVTHIVDFCHVLFVGDKLYRFRLHRNDKLEGNSGMIFTSRHLSRRNFQLFDSQSTVNSQQSTVNSQQSTVNSQQSTVNSQHHSGVTGIDITVCTKLAATLSFAQFLAFAKSEFLELISSFLAVLTSSKHLQPSLKLLRGEESSH